MMYRKLKTKLLSNDLKGGSLITKHKLEEFTSNDSIGLYKFRSLDFF